MRTNAFIIRWPPSVNVKRDRNKHIHTYSHSDVIMCKREKENVIEVSWEMEGDLLSTGNMIIAQCHSGYVRIVNEETNTSEEESSHLMNYPPTCINFVKFAISKRSRLNTKWQKRNDRLPVVRFPSIHIEHTTEGNGNWMDFKRTSLPHFAFAIKIWLYVCSEQIKFMVFRCSGLLFFRINIYFLFFASRLANVGKKSIDFIQDNMTMVLFGTEPCVSIYDPWFMPLTCVCVRALM